MDLLSSTLGAVGQVGDAIDKYTGGRAVRGTLAGKPRELASIVPFSDTMGLTRPEDATSGRDLTDQYGLTTKGSNSFGSHAAGFLADNVLSPANWLGAGAAFKAAPTVAKGLGGAAKALTGADLLDHVAGGVKKLGGFLGGESGALKIGRAPWTPQEIARKTGITPGHMGFDEASTAYQSWVNSLYPEEQSAVKLFTSGPQAKISHALRGASSSSGGHPLNPFDDSHSGSTIPGTPTIKSPDDVSREVVPYLDSGLSRGATPKDVMTYRLSGQIGNLTADNASKMVGKTVSDPSYMSTTINPWGRFYGNNANPKDLLLDILAPKGSPGGYADALSSWNAEKELLLPRGSQFKVHGVHDVPVQKIGHEYYRLDPAGKPIPKPGNYGSSLFAEDAADKFYGDVAKQGSFGDTVVPDELMAPNWREIASRNLQGEGSQKNVLLRMMSEGQLAPHEASVGRMTAQQMWGELMARFNSPEGQIPEGFPVARTLKDMASYSKVGKYPDESYLRNLASHGGIRTDDILRSRPKSGGILDAIKNFGKDESGALDIGAFGSKGRSGLASKAVSTTQVNTAIQEAAKQFGGYASNAQYGDFKDLAERFIRPPELPSDPAQAKQLADQFTDKMSKGRDAASTYFGPTYYDINNYLRTLGPEAAQAEVQAIREGRARVPVQSASQAAAASIDNWDDTPTLPPSQYKEIGDHEKYGLDDFDTTGIDTSGWDDFLKENNSTVFGDHPGHETPIAGKQFPHPVTGDPLGVGEIFKMKKGKGNPEFVMGADGTHKPFVPEPSKPDAFDEADFFGLPPDAAAFTPDPAKIKGLLSELGYSGTHLFGKNQWNDPSDWDGVQSAAKKIFGDQYGQYVQHIHDSNGYDNNPFGSIPIPGMATPAGSHYAKPSPLAKDTLDPDEAFRLEGIRKHIAGLSGLIDHSALPQDMDLYRGVDGPGMRKISELIGAPLNSPEAVGREFVDPAFVSTAFDKRTADSFAGLSSGYNRPDSGVTFSFPQVPAGKPASFMNGSEHEVLFPPGRKIKITDNSNYPHLKAELYGTLLATILGRQAAQYGGQNGNP